VSPGFVPQGLPLRGSTDATLLLHRADTFVSRLKGLYGRGRLGPHEGLILVPCAAIHTFFMREPMDVVFLDRRCEELRHIIAMPPFGVARCQGAYATVELPPEYCVRYPDYLARIHAAIRRGNSKRPQEPARADYSDRKTLT
jgi:Uncharacterized conserved protein